MGKRISRTEIEQQAKVLAQRSGIPLGKARLQLIWRYAGNKSVDIYEAPDLDFTDKPAKPQGVVYVPPKT